MTDPVLGDFTVVRRIQTRWQDNDNYGHVNNAVYYSYLDTAVTGWLFDSVGDIRELAELGLVVSSRCDFKRPLSFPDVLDIGVGTGRVGNSSISYRLAVYREGDPELCALGEFVHVYVDAQTRTPVPIPEQVRRHADTLTHVDF